MSNNDVVSANQRRLSEKLVIVINGKGGAGKDTVCEAAAKHFRVSVISSITPIKEIAACCGWTGEKDNKSRKFLADLKALLIDYNGLPNNYLEKEYDDFIHSENDLLFVHIREGSQIDDFKKRIPTKCVTLIVRSPVIDDSRIVFGNVSDDDVEAYDYDYSYINSAAIEALDSDFVEFLGKMFAAVGIRVI